MSTTTPIYCRFKSDVHYRMVPLFVPRFDPTCPIVRRARLHGNISLAKLQQRCRILAAYLRHTCGILVAYLCHTCGILATYLRHTCGIVALQLCTATMPQLYSNNSMSAPRNFARQLCRNHTSTLRCNHARSQGYCNHPATLPQRSVLYGYPNV